MYTRVSKVVADQDKLLTQWRKLGSVLPVKCFKNLNLRKCQQ